MKYNIVVAITTVGCPALNTICGYIRSEFMFENEPQFIENLRSSLIESLQSPALRGLLLYTMDDEPIIEVDSSKMPMFKPTTIFVPASVLVQSVATFQIVEIPS